MRHRKNFNHLSRKSEHRKAMLANMASSLIMHKRIRTTLAKARALRSYVEPLITKSKLDTTHSRRVVFSYLQNKDAVSELFREISVKVAERPGGYTRIIKTGTRLGDNAEMCLIELVDFNENLLGVQETGKAKTTRRRRGGAKKKTEAAVEEKVAATKKTEKVAEKKEEPRAAAAEAEEKPAEVKADIKESAAKVEEKVTEDKTEVETTEEKAEEAATEAKTDEPVAESKPEEKAEDAAPEEKNDDTEPEKK